MIGVAYKIRHFFIMVFFIDFLVGRRIIVPLDLANVGLNALIVGWPMAGWHNEVLYC